MISEMLNQLTDQLGDTYKKLNEAEKELEAKDAEIAALKNKNEELKIDLSVQWGRGDVLDKENSALKDTITSLRVQLAVIGEYVKDKVNFVLEAK